MEERYATLALQEFPQLSLLHFLSPQNQDLVKDYLVYIRARRYGPAMQEGTIRALKNFIVLMPEARQATLSHDLTQTTAMDVDAWIEAAFRHPLAPSTVATRLRVLQGSNSRSSPCNLFLLMSMGQFGHPCWLDARQTVIKIGDMSVSKQVHFMLWAGPTRDDWKSPS